MPLNKLEIRMKPIRYLGLVLLLFSAALPALGGGPKDDDKKNNADGFVPMFNGKDLTGWVNVNCAPGTFYVKNNEIITTGKPTGYLRTQKQYENFIAEFEWMHIPPSPGAVGNSGFFVWADPLPAVGSPYTRGIEVQVLVNLEYKNKKGQVTATSQGDLFSIWGARCVPDRPHPDGWERCLPSENRARGAGEWNHYRVEAKDGVIKLHVNGKVVSGLSKCRPRKGYLALESEGSECHFRNLRIKELPSSDPAQEEIANQAQGHQNLFTGLDLAGWKADADANRHWQPRDYVLHYDGKGKELRTEKEYADAEFIADFRIPAQKGKTLQPCKLEFRDQVFLEVPLTKDHSLSFIQPTGVEQRLKRVKNLKANGQWNRLQVALKGTTFRVALNGEAAGEIDMKGAAPKGFLALLPSEEMDFANLFVRELP